MIDLSQFQAWAKEGPRRAVDIKIREGKVETIWVFDYNLMEGQHVQSVGEIDLEGEQVKAEKAEFERLSAKYGGQK